MNFIPKTIKKIIPDPFKVFYIQMCDYLRRTNLGKRLPFKLVLIETTTYCNLKCKGCYRTTHDYPSKNKQMSLDDFKIYINQLPRADNLTLHGMGEPTINPALPEMVEYARKSGKFKRITFTTNALVHNPIIYDELFQRGLSDFSISVDSLDPQEVAKLRPSTDVELLIKNIKYLVDKYSDKIKFGILISKGNINTFHQTIKKLTDIGAKLITCGLFSDFGYPVLCLSSKEKKEFLERKKQIKIKGVKIISTGWFKPVTQPCRMVNQAVLVEVDGNLAPCCYKIDRGISFGNLKKTPFKKDIFLKKNNDLQRNITKGKYPSFCKSCLGNHIEFKLKKEKQ
ncbi:radical SAM protein [Patescibacteria group bacterium]|nr:radical SAM protein [Patescibacteria group bacterium]